MRVKAVVLALSAFLGGGVSVLQAQAQSFSAVDNLLVNGGFNVKGFPYPDDLTSVLAPWVWTGSIAYSWANDGPAVGPGVVLDAGGVVGFGDGSIYQDVATL